MALGGVPYQTKLYKKVFFHLRYESIIVHHHMSGMGLSSSDMSLMIILGDMSLSPESISYQVNLSTTGYFHRNLLHDLIILVMIKHLCSEFPWK